MINIGKQKRRTVVRLLFGVVLLVAVGVVAQAAVSGETTGATAPPPNITGEYDGRVAVTAHGDTEKSKLAVYGPDGSPTYVDAEYDRYFDVDPHRNESNTLTYTAAKHVYGSPCGTSTQCSRNVIEKVNLTTGETEIIFERYRPKIFNGRWHDADRVDQDRWVIADIENDRVMVVNTTTGNTAWSWNAQQRYNLTTGREYPTDWTHINDVEVVRDGLIMVSVRNQDSVLFLDSETGVVDDLTLGAEDNYDVLNEQHNPDYIPAERGGPAVLVADSHNNRIVEYQREGDSWVESWTWADTRMQWPRDADRLPNGNTLVTDSSGNRLLEVAPDGSIVWSVTIDTPYEAERLGTGDESAGGTAAATLGLEDRTPSGVTEESDSQASILLQILIEVRELLPAIVVNAVLYVLPTWVQIEELAAIATAGGVGLLWTALEYWWAQFSIGVQSPIKLRR